MCVGRDVIAEQRPDHAGEQYNIGHWMSANRLKLNADKTELLWTGKTPPLTARRLWTRLTAWC